MNAVHYLYRGTNKINEQIESEQIKEQVFLSICDVLQYIALKKNKKISSSPQNIIFNV